GDTLAIRRGYARPLQLCLELGDLGVRTCPGTLEAGLVLEVVKRTPVQVGEIDARRTLRKRALSQQLGERGVVLVLLEIENDELLGWFLRGQAELVHVVHARAIRDFDGGRERRRILIAGVVEQ